MKRCLKLITALVLTISLTFLFGCKTTKISKSVPYGNLGDASYLTTTIDNVNYTVSEKELYDAMKLSRSSSGYSSVTKLDDMVAKIVLKDEIEKVKKVFETNENGQTIYDLDGNKTEKEYLNDLFKDGINSSCYSTTDEETIEGLTEGQKTRYEQQYLDSLTASGIILDYDSQTETIAEAALRTTLLDDFFLARAKINYAKSILVDEIKDEDDTNYFDESEDYESYFDSTLRTSTDNKVIVVKFNSLDEYNKATVNFNKDSDLEALESIVSIYNNVYGQYRETITYESQATLEEAIAYLLENNDELLTQDSTSSLSSNLLAYIAGTLSVEDGNYYSKQSLAYSSNYYLVFKLVDTETLSYEEKKVEYPDLDLLVMQNYLNSRLTSTYTNTKYQELLEDTDIEIYDPYLELIYSTVNSSIKTSKATSTTNVAKIKDTTISVADFYKALETVYGPTTAFDLLVNKIIVNSKYMNEVTTTEKTQFETDLDTIVANYKSGSYSSYGITSTLKESDFYKMYFNKTSKSAVLTNYYTANRALELLLEDYETIPDIYDKFALATEDLYNQTFAINCFHFLIYLDYEDSDSPYNPNTYLEDLGTEAERNKFKNAVLSLMNKVFDMLTTNEGLEVESSYDATLDYIINQYNSSNKFANDEWSMYHQLGLKLRKESLGEITNTSVLNYDEKFAGRVVELANMDLDLSDETLGRYDAYVDSEKGNAETYDELLASSFGYHLIFVTEQTENSSAKYTADMDTKETYKEISYEDREGTLNAYSDNDYPSSNQIEIYLREKDYSTGIENLPSTKTNSDGVRINVKSTLETFFGDIYTKYTSDANSLFILNYVVNNYQFASADAQKLFTETLEVARRSFTEYSYVGVDFIENPYNEWFTIFYN